MQAERAAAPRRRWSSVSLVRTAAPLSGGCQNRAWRACALTSVGNLSPWAAALPFRSVAKPLPPRHPRISPIDVFGFPPHVCQRAGGSATQAKCRSALRPDALKHFLRVHGHADLASPRVGIPADLNRVGSARGRGEIYNLERVVPAVRSATVLPLGPRIDRSRSMLIV